MADQHRSIPYEPGLDGLRAVSVVGVLCFHAFALSGHPGWMRGGNLGVSVFFTLSGFLITTLLLGERATTGGIDLGRFWGRRVQRLVPASTAVVLAVVVLSATDVLSARSSDVVAAVWSATNWHVIAGGDGQLLQTIVGPLGPTWSLAVEEQFYLCLVLAVWVAARSRQPECTLAWVFGVVGAAAVVAANLATDWQPHLEFGTEVRAAELVAGGLLALAWRRPAIAGVLRRFAPRAAWPALAALAGLFLLADYTPPWLLRGGFVVVAAVSCTLVAAVMSGGSLQRVLAAAPLVAVGRWSYSLYLVHWPVYLVATPERLGLHGLPLALARMGLAFAVAVALHRLVEQPVRRLAVRPTTAIAAWLGISSACTVLALTVL